jgi:hypothetical protein
MGWNQAQRFFFSRGFQAEDFKRFPTETGVRTTGSKRAGMSLSQAGRVSRMTPGPVHAGSVRCQTEATSSVDSMPPLLISFPPTIASPMFRR